MKVFKIMGLYLIAAITLTACSKDSATQSNLPLEDSSVNLTAKRAIDYDIQYYTATQTLGSEMQRKGIPELPLSLEDWNHYTSLIDLDLDVAVEDVNQIADRVLFAQEIGLKDYMNDHMELKDFTKTKILEIAELGPVKNLTKSSDFRSLPELEQNMLLSANAIALDYEPYYTRASMGTADRAVFVIIIQVTSTIAGAVVGWQVGQECCGTAGAIVGALLGGIAGFFTAGASK